MPRSVCVSAFQGRAIYGDIPQALKVIKETMRQTEKENVDILCFPECFLQEFTWDDEEKTRAVSIDLGSGEFAAILDSLFSEKLTIILGLIEREKEKIFNTAVVIEKGKPIGKYRKRHIHNKESFFTCGVDSPIFEKSGIKYGINICYDSRFPDSAELLVQQGAQIIFCPLNNSLPHEKANNWKDKHLPYFIDKAKMSGCWIVTADVVEQSETNTGYGCTCLVSPEGEVVECLEQLKQEMFTRQITVGSSS